jgi:hypothetical protein
MNWINNEGLIFLGKTIYFWIISLTLFLVIIIQNCKLLKNKINNLISKLKELLQSRQTTERQTSENLNRVMHNFLYAVIMLGISLGVVFFIEIAKEIYNNTIKGTPNAYPILLVFLLIFSVSWLVFIVLGQYNKKLQISFTFIMVLSILLYFYTKNNQIIITSIIIIALFLFPYWSYKEKIKYPLWLITTILIIVLMFSLGLFLIDYNYGYKNPKLILNIDGDVSNRYNSENSLLVCSSNNRFENKILPNKEIVCEIIPNDLQQIINYTIKFEDSSGISYIYEGQNENIIKLIMPNNKTRDLFFEAKIKTSEGRLIRVTTYHKYQTYTYEEWEERNDKYLYYLLGLIGVIFFSVPLMMVNLRNLSKQKTSTEF